MADPRVINNWAGNQSFTPRSVEEPSTLHELVDAVRRAAAHGRHVRALGSVWSFPDVVRCTDVAVLPTNLRGILAVAKAPAWDGTLGSALRPALKQNAERAFVHVRSGERLVDALEKLAAEGLTLPTMGSSAGQTVVGVTATGSHGADFDLRPVADLVRAVHIVVGDGTQHWIEGAGGDALTTAEGVALLAPGVALGNVHRDDELLRAALVHLGSLGVIHSVVLEVRREHGLHECVVRLPWSDVVDGLKTGRWFTTPPVRPAIAPSPDEKYRYLEIHVNAYPAATGQRWARVITRFERPTIDRPTFRRRSRDVDLLEQLTILGTLTQGVDEDYRRTIDALHALGREDTGGYAPSRFVLNTGSQGKLPVLSLEIAVPTTGGAHVRVLEGMLAEFDRLHALGKYFAGFWSVRFTRPTRALLGMQHVPDAVGGELVRVCHIEVFSLQQIRANLKFDPLDMWGENEAFVREFVRVARREKARLHWGQLGRPYADQEGAWYPEAAAFRAAKKKLAAPSAPHAFENDFTVRAGLAALEPGWTSHGLVTGPSSAAPSDTASSARRAPTLATGALETWIVAANGDGRVGFARYGNEAWELSDAPSRSGHVVSDLAVMGRAAAAAVVVAAFDDGRLWRTQLKNDRADGWTVFDGQERFAAGPAMVEDAQGKLRVYAVSGGRIVESREDAGGWSRWSALPLPTSGAAAIGQPAAVVEGGRVRVVARTVAGEVHGWVEDAGAWRTANLGEPSDQDPVLVATPVGTVVALVHGSQVRVGVADGTGAFGFVTVPLGRLLAGTRPALAEHKGSVSIGIVDTGRDLVLADFESAAKTWSVRHPVRAAAVSGPALLSFGARLFAATRAAHDLVQVAIV